MYAELLRFRDPENELFPGSNQALCVDKRCFVKSIFHRIAHKGFLYQIGSVKKVFTTLGMLILENDGQISLEDLKFTKTALHFAK